MISLTYTTQIHKSLKQKSTKIKIKNNLNIPAVYSCVEAISCQNTGVWMETFRIGWDGPDLTHVLFRPLWRYRGNLDAVKSRRHSQRLASCSGVQHHWSWMIQRKSEGLKVKTEEALIDTNCRGRYPSSSPTQHTRGYPGVLLHLSEVGSFSLASCDPAISCTHTDMLSQSSLYMLGNFRKLYTCSLCLHSAAKNNLCG